MLKNDHKQALKVLFIGALFAGYSQAGYSQNIEVNEIDAVEYEVPENGEVTIPNSTESGSGFDAQSECAVPGTCGSSGTSDDNSQDLTPSEEAEAISNGWTK